jgi:hypothetical protein
MSVGAWTLDWTWHLGGELVCACGRRFDASIGFFIRLPFVRHVGAEAEQHLQWW